MWQKKTKQPFSIDFSTEADYNQCVKNRPHQKTQFQKQFSKNADWPDIIYGINPIQEALLAGKRQFFEILISTHKKEEKNFDQDPLYRLIQKKKVPFSFVDKQRLTDLSRFGLHQGFVARVSQFAYADLSAVMSPSEKKFFVILDCLNDPQNFGAICRSAWAFGVDAIIVPKDNMSPVNEVVCKASSGAVEHLPIVEVTNLARTMKQLKDDGFWIYGMSLSDQAKDIRTFKADRKTALVLGSEGSGLRRLVAETCDQLLKISLAKDFDSLNVSQAASIVFYETFYQMQNL